MNKLYIKLFAWLAKKTIDKLAPNIKTFLAGFITFLLGAAETLSDGAFYRFCCENLHLFCNLSASEFYGGLIGILGFINQLFNGSRVLNHVQGVTPDPSIDDLK